MTTSKYEKINTQWNAGTKGNQGTLQYTVLDRITRKPHGPEQDFSIKGVCYSPCPIGESNKNGPNIGDWFWDSFSVNRGPMIWNWSRYWETNDNDATYRADLDRIKALGANALRVYCMLPYQFNSGGSDFDTSITHTHFEFLDACYERGLFVLVGFPFPGPYFVEGQNPAPPASEWLNNYIHLLETVGSHPAVMGFTLLNEKDGNGISFVDPKKPDSHKTQVEYYWDTIQMLASTAKQHAPGKLVGQAFHDMPSQWSKANAAYLNKASDVDFWGVNTYQNLSLAPLFDPIPASYALGFDGLKQLTDEYPNVYKPVILTEIGWPGTSHHDNKIYYDEATGEKAANTITTVCPQAFSQPLCLGMFYFEYCDEWWAQSEGAIFEWNGGQPSPGMPNGYTDLEGFGLFQTKKNPKIPGKPDNPAWPVNWNASGNGPYPYTDPLTDRQPLTSALKKVFTRH